MSGPNPLLRALGLSPADRAVIVHADDVGMCHASVAAFAELAEAGRLASGSLMVPCPWFRAAAALAARGGLDLGVHLTLTSEWPHYRWGPLTTRDRASGLVDAQGAFPSTVAELAAHADAAAVEREIEAQIALAAEAGIDVTHADAHMSALLEPRFWAAYVGLAMRRRLPVLLPRHDRDSLLRLGLPPEVAAAAAAQLEALEGTGFPLVDRYLQLPLDEPRGRVAQLRDALAPLPPGLTHLIVHPARDGAELRAVASDWPGRVADFELLASGGAAAVLDELGYRTVTWRAVRDAYRAPAPTHEERA